MTDTIESLADSSPAADEVAPLLDIDGTGDPDPTPTSVVESPSTPPPGVRQLSEAEYELMSEKSGIIDLIQENPQLAQYVTDTLRNGLNNSNEPEIPDGGFGQDITQHPAFKSLMGRVERAENGAKQAAAAAQVMSFGQEHPDLPKYREEITNLVQNHGMDLPTAYKHAKALAGDHVARANPAIASAEGRGRGTSPVQEGDSDLLAAATRKINDPTRRVRIEDAMDIAFEAATRQHNSETGER